MAGKPSVIIAEKIVKRIAEIRKTNGSRAIIDTHVWNKVRIDAIMEYLDELYERGKI